MKTKFLPFLLFPLLGAAGVATAQDAAAATTPVRVDQSVYTQRLPSVAELTNAAAAQGRTVQRIEQTAAQVTVSYQQANGQVTTVAYLLLPAAGTASVAPASAPTAAPTVVVPASPAPTVVYADPPPRVVYYSDGPYYSYPRYYYPPVSLSLGFGFRGGHYHGGYHGGFGFHHR